MRNFESGTELSTIPQIKRLAGRPRKFQTVEELEDAIQNYFDSCFVPATERIKVRTGDDEDQSYEFVDSPILGKSGEVTFYRIKPFTVTGLAIALGTTRDLLLDYEKNPDFAIYSDTIKAAKQVIQDFAESRLFANAQVTGAIFSLKNNYGWVDRTETDITSKNKSIAPEAAQAKAADILGRKPVEEIIETENSNAH